MKKLKIFFYITFINIAILSCSNKDKELNKEAIEQSPRELYQIAMINIDQENYEEASLIFKEIIYKYPLSNEGVQSEIMLGFIEYVRMNYDDSIYKFNRIIKIYPSHKNIDYVYYMRAISYFEQISGENFDGKSNREAKKNFQELLNRFPDSEYAKDSRQKLIFIEENIAAKNMEVAIFYLKQKQYLAALGRYNKVIEEYPKSKFIPEALYRLVEIYTILGMKEEAEKAASVIVYNYPQSKWYEDSYNLINEEYYKKNKTNLGKKILNLFKKNESKE
mgnify:CR=1 FL=1|tara:strand:- start:2075 stop:2905 length:831 start_codon:yes stop_codon:yes gene_type:complete